jgi:hypothetical protein
MPKTPRIMVKRNSLIQSKNALATTLLSEQRFLSPKNGSDSTTLIRQVWPPTDIYFFSKKEDAAVMVSLSRCC